MTGVRKVAGIILAAGEGTRMGRTKQLLPFRGKTILECVIDSALASGLHRVVVVLGHQADLLQPLLENGDPHKPLPEKRGVEVIVNPLYRQGQSSSLKSGLHALSEESEAALFLLGDQPLITPKLIDLILAAYQASPSPIVLPLFQGKRGNPVLFSRETFPRIEALGEDCGARLLFQEYATRLLAVAVDDPAIHFDIDTQEDYQRLLQAELG